MVFLLDSSSTIGRDNFRKLEDFLKDVVQDLNVSPDGVHVGLMQYSSYPSLEFPLDRHTSRYDVLKAIDNVSSVGRRDGSVGRASDSRYKDPKDRRFEPRLGQEHKNKMGEFFRVKNVVLTCSRCGVPNPRVYTHEYE